MAYAYKNQDFSASGNQPISSISEIGNGMPLPPEKEQARLRAFDEWHNWSNRKYVGLYPESAPEAQRRFSQQQGAVPFRLAPNMFRFIMGFWADAIASDSPIFSYGDEKPKDTTLIEPGGINPPPQAKSRQQEFLDVLTNPLLKASRLVVQDMIRYGVGVFWSRQALIPEALDPRCWFPVREPYDLSENLGDVIAIPYSNIKPGVNDRVLVVKYLPETGPVARLHILEGTTLGNGIQALNIQGSENSIVPVRSREGMYGKSDFADIGEYVAELHRRESSISTALDRHVNPHLSVPEGSLNVQADGTVTVANEGMVIPLPDGSAPPSYVTWQPDFTAQEIGIQRAEQRVLRMASIAPILATPGEFARSGAIPSGTALRRLAVISVNRLKSIREELTEAWKKVIPAQVDLYAQQDGEKLDFDVKKLNIEWPPEFSAFDDLANVGGGEENPAGPNSPKENKDKSKEDKPDE